MHGICIFQCTIWKSRTGTLSTIIAKIRVRQLRIKSHIKALSRKKTQLLPLISQSNLQGLGIKCWYQFGTPLDSVIGLVYKLSLSRRILLDSNREENQRPCLVSLFKRSVHPACSTSSKWASTLRCEFIRSSGCFSPAKWQEYQWNWIECHQKWLHFSAGV